MESALNTFSHILFAIGIVFWFWGTWPLLGKPQQW